MPTTRQSAASGITSRGPTVDDADFSVSLQVRDTIVTAGSTADSTVNDRNITTQTSATVDRAGDLDAVESVIGTFTPYLNFESLDTNIATVDSVGNVTRVSDGTARILAKTRMMTKRIDVAVSRSVTTTVVLNSYTNGSLAKECSEAVDTRIAGKTASAAKPIYTTANHDASTYVRNTGCWAADIDLTCVSPWNSSGGISYAGTAISPRHIIFARHYQIPAGATIRFVTTSNTVVTRTLSAVQDIAGTGYPYDLTVGRLDSDLPASITPAKVLPSTVANYFPSLSTLYSIPCLGIDREEKALITELYSLGSSYVSFHQPADATRLNYYESLIGGDSGNPCFAIIGGQAVLVTTWTFGGGGTGPRIHALHTEINAAMTTLGGGYQLTDVSLSAFTDFS
jgi:hypothetical protein